MNLIIGFISVWLVALHPLHISVSEVEHDEESKALEITMRIFLDDIEKAIAAEIGQKHLDITSPGKNYTTDGLIEAYLKKHFKVLVNGKEKEYNYLGNEIELPVLFVYVEVENIRKIKEISIYNSILTETFDDQSNLVHIKANGETKSMRLTAKQTSDVLKY